MSDNIHEILRKHLFELADTDYRKFSKKLMPSVEKIIGVRLPLLRKEAKSIARNDWRTFLESPYDEYFEEIMLHGMVIGYIKAAPEEILTYAADFIPLINNWSVCDSFCIGLKFTNTNKELVWSFLQPYLESEKEFEVRFAVVMLLNYYICSDYIDRVLIRLDKIEHQGYYVKMAVAWAVAECFAEYPSQTLHFLKTCITDDFTFNKSLQKIKESNKIEPHIKAMIISMKR